MTTPDTQPEAQARFLRILNDEAEQAAGLLELLEQEFELLASAPGDALEKLLELKKARLKTIEQTADAHHRFLQQQGLSGDRRGTESYLAACPDNATLHEHWRRYLTLLQSCQNQNAINGGAVAVNQRQVNQALNLLLDLGNVNKTYGRSGESLPSRPSKTLGKA